MEQLTTIGDYEVRAIDAVGGVVRYEATHLVLPRRAWIELLDPAAPRAAAVRLLRHACILEALRHDAVPRVFECGRLDGRPWVAFERCEGAPLDAELRERGLDVGQVLALLEQVGAILCHAHARGVLHRDVTPAAIVRDPSRGFVLQGWLNAATYDAELVTPLRGSNRYRAPELAHDRPADGRADVFALGTIALQALTGQDAPAPLPGDVPAALATLLGEMTSDDPLTRPSATEVMSRVRAISAAAEVAPYDDSLEVVLEYAPTATPIEIDVVIEDDDSEPVLLDRRRTRPRWTPQWGVEAPGEAARRVVEIQPRHRRPATEDAD